MSNSARPILLVVHEDNQLLRQIAKMVSEVAYLIPSRGAGKARSLLDSDQPINAALVGKAADSVSAIDMLRWIREKRPQVRSMLLGDSCDLSISIEALHLGIVDHIISPPLRERELLAILALPTPRVITPEITGQANSTTAQ